ARRARRSRRPLFECGGPEWPIAMHSVPATALDASARRHAPAIGAADRWSRLTIGDSRPPGRAVPGAGVEPAHPCGQRLLRPPCLPFHHPGVGETWTSQDVSIPCRPARLCGRARGFTPPRRPWLSGSAGGAVLQLQAEAPLAGRLSVTEMSDQAL